MEGISSIKAGNKFLGAFIDDYNQRFGKEPLHPVDVHRPLGERENLDDVFTIQEKRQLCGNLTFRYQNTVYAVGPIAENLKLKHGAITVMTQCDGRMRVRHGKTDLRIVKDHRRASRAAPPMRAGHKDLTGIMNRLMSRHARGDWGLVGAEDAVPRQLRPHIQVAARTLKPLTRVQNRLLEPSRNTGALSISQLKAWHRRQSGNTGEGHGTSLLCGQCDICTLERQLAVHIH